jgi:hypothetical protein
VFFGRVISLLLWRGMPILSNLFHVSWVWIKPSSFWISLPVWKNWEIWRVMTAPPNLNTLKPGGTQPTSLLRRRSR